MKNTFGSSVCVTLFGESHGTKIGAVLDGLTPGIPVDEELALKKCAKSVGVKSVQMIHMKELFPLTGYVRGGYNPFFLYVHYL